MNLPRFYLPEIHPGEQPLPEDQSHHALHVLRMNDSDEMVVFDGAGKWAKAKLLVRRKHAYCQVDGPIREDPPPALRITLACATPKADRALTLVEQVDMAGLRFQCSPAGRRRRKNAKMATSRRGIRQTVRTQLASGCSTASKIGGHSGNGGIGKCQNFPG